MPSFTRDTFPHNAKITEFSCDYCGITAYAQYSNAKYCSDLCRHNAYELRKENEQRDNHRIITKKSRDNQKTLNKVRNSRSVEKCIGAYLVQNYFAEMNVKVTIKSIKGIAAGDTMNIANYVVERVNIKCWEISK